MLAARSSPAMEDPASAVPKEEESALVCAARAGDRVAMGRLYQRYLGVVRGLIMARVPLSEVDDLVHDVFLQAMRKLGSLRDSAAFAAWLAAIARNRVVDSHRSRQPAPPAFGETASAPGAGPSALDAHAILGLIHELPLAYRETLILRLVEGMTGPEIAARAGLTPDSVRVNLHRGMKMLRERLAARGGELT